MAQVGAASTMLAGMRFVPELDDERAMTRLRRAVMVVLLAGFVACAGESGSAPADPTQLPPGVTQPPPGSGQPAPAAAVSGAPPTTTDLDGVEPDHVPPPEEATTPATALPVTTTRQRLAGFGEVLVEVHRVDGEVVSWCLLLAETPAQTQRGLMEVTDPGLGGYDGMLFRFDGDRESSFYMRNTPQPLEIAYLDAVGTPVGIIRMEPCGDGDDCPATYSPSAPYRRTIEVPVAAGGVASLGIEPGSRVVDTGVVCST